MDDAKDGTKLCGGRSLLPGLYGVEGCLQGGAQPNAELQEQEGDDGPHEDGLGGAWLSLGAPPCARHHCRRRVRCCLAHRAGQEARCCTGLTTDWVRLTSTCWSQSLQCLLLQELGKGPGRVVGEESWDQLGRHHVLLRLRRRIARWPGPLHPAQLPRSTTWVWREIRIVIEVLRITWTVLVTMGNNAYVKTRSMSNS